MLGQLLSAWLKGQSIIELTLVDLEFAVKPDVVKLALFFWLGRLQADLEELSLVMIVSFDAALEEIGT